MNIQLIVNASDKIVLEVLKQLRQSPDGRVRTDVLQTELRLGYARVSRLLDLLETAGIISVRVKSKMVIGKDGKRHRKYSPRTVIVSSDELDECITALDMARFNRIKGSMFAGAAGDALGNPVEFLSLASIKQRYGEMGITEPELENGKAVITDDTQMSLFTAEGIFLWAECYAENSEAKLEDFVYAAYKDWLYTQGGRLLGGTKHKPVTKLFDIPELNVARAPGNTCMSALQSGKMGTLEEPLNNSKGCGGVMRVAPVGLYFGCDMQDTDIDKTVIMGAKIAAITHGHPLGYISAAALTYIVNEIVYGRSDTLKEVFENAIRAVERLFPQAETEELAQLIYKAFELADSDISVEEAINRLGEGWCGDSALAIAIYCCLKYHNVADVLCAAVNFNGDSDSVGAIAGNIIGAWLGFDAIPKKYIENLELKTTLEDTANRLWHK